MEGLRRSLARERVLEMAGKQQTGRNRREVFVGKRNEISNTFSSRLQ